MAIYKIQLSGRGTERGVGKITEAQYEYWSDESKEYDLADALTENYDYDENQTPEEARFKYPWFEYSEVAYQCGLDDDAWIEIIDPTGTKIVNTELSSYFNEVFGEDIHEHWEEMDEFYIEYEVKSGCYVSWAQGGKGTYFEFEIDVDQFDPKKLKVETFDFEGNSMVVKLFYDGEELENNGGDWWGKWSDYSLYKAEEQ